MSYASVLWRLKNFALLVYFKSAISPRKLFLEEKGVILMEFTIVGKSRVAEQLSGT